MTNFACAPYVAAASNGGSSASAERVILRFIAISVFGVYAVQVSVFSLLLTVGSGVAAYYLSKNDYPIAPLVLSPSWGR